MSLRDTKNIMSIAYGSVNGIELKSLEKRPAGTFYKVLDDLPGAPMSEKRSSWDTSPVRLSAVALLLDKIILRRQVSAYSSKEALYAEIDNTPLLVDDDGVHVETMPHPAYLLWAFVLFLAYVKKDKELRSQLNKAFIEAEKTGVVAINTAGMLCDSFFYCGITTFNVISDLVLPTVEAAFRADTMRSALPETYQTEPKLVSTAKQEKVEEKRNARANISRNELWERVKQGEFRLDHQWTETAKERIKPLRYLDSFVPNEIFFKVLQKMVFRYGRILRRMSDGLSNQDAISTDNCEIALTGNPGTGKTTLVYALSAALGLPVYVEAVSSNTDESDFLGKTRFIDGSPCSVPTETVLATELGGICLVEEANLLKNPGILMGCLGQAIEYPFILKRDGYEIINRHPLTTYIITMNVGTSGSRQISEPFDNRFRTHFVFESPKPTEFIDILMVRSGMKKYICSWVYQIYEKVQKALRSDEFGAADTESILLTLSLRSCIGALQLIEEGEHPKDAIRESIVNKIAGRDREVAAAIGSMVDSLKDLHIEGDIYENC